MSLRATTPSAPRITAELQVGRETSSFVGQLAATGRAIPLLAGLLYLAVGVWLMLGVGYFVQDALSRTGNAMYVVFGRDPHLAALGFVWNPLPSLLQVPLVLVLDPLGLVYLAGPIISAAFGGATLWVFDRIYRLLGVAGRWRWALLLLYGLNPLVVVYAANGLSEGPFIFFLVASVYAYLRWVHGGGYSALMWFSFCTAGAFTVRYEAIPFAAVAIVVVIATFLASEKIDPPKLEATLLAFLIPIAY